MKKVGKSTENIGKNLMTNITVPVVGLGTIATKSAMDFKENIANIDTLLDDHSHLKGYEQQVLAVSKATGMNLDTVAKGMYTAISSLGDGGKETEKIFKTMADAAKAGGAEVNDSVALISAAMKGYGSVSDDTAKKISDLAFQTAKLGVTTFPEMAKSMQPLFPLAKSLNFSYEELFGSMATLTGVTGNTSEVSTQLKAVFSNLMKPTTEMSNLISKYGFENAQSMIKSKGLVGVMEILQKETGGNADKMGKLFSSTEAVTALTALTGQNFKDLVNKTKEMNKATGSTDKALKKVSNTTKDKFNKALNNLKVSLTELGVVLLPVVTQISNSITKVADNFNKLSKSQKEAIVKLLLFAAAVGPVVFVLGKATTNISKTIKGINNFTTAIKKAGGIMKYFTSPGHKVILIMTALALVAILVITHWDKIRKCFNKVASTISKATGISSNSVKKFLKVILQILPSALMIGKIFESGFGSVFKILGKTIGFVTKGMIRVLARFFAFMLANPIVAVITIIIGACVMLYEAWKHNWGGIREKTHAVIEFCKEKINSIKSVFENVKQKCAEFKDSICRMWDGIKTFLAHPIQGTVSLVQHGDLSGVKGKNALGTNYWGGGLSVVGEHGPEIVEMPAGSKVHDNKDSNKMFNKNNIQITFRDVHVREESDIDKIAAAIVKKLQIQQLNSV